MAKSKTKTIELVSVSYRMNGKEHTAKLNQNKSAGNHEFSAKLDNDGANDCGPDCRCVNGFAERLVTFGGVSQWMKTNEPC